VHGLQEQYGLALPSGDVFDPFNLPPSPNPSGDSDMPGGTYR
jgi:hypothetical protein